MIEAHLHGGPLDGSIVAMEYGVYRVEVSGHAYTVRQPFRGQPLVHYDHAGWLWRLRCWLFGARA
jgi:hypothetical protein